MEYIDLRKVGKEGLKQIRSQVVRLKKMGKSGKEIEELVGVRQNRISEIWTAYPREGEKSLEWKRTDGNRERICCWSSTNRKRYARQSFPCLPLFLHPNLSYLLEQK